MTFTLKYECTLPNPGVRMRMLRASMKRIEKERNLEDGALLIPQGVVLTLGMWVIQCNSHWVPITYKVLCQVLETQGQMLPTTAIKEFRLERETKIPVDNHRVNWLTYSGESPGSREYIRKVGVAGQKISRDGEGQCRGRGSHRHLCSSAALYKEGLEICSFLCYSPFFLLFILRTLSLTRSSFIIVILIHHDMEKYVLCYK